MWFFVIKLLNIYNDDNVVLKTTFTYKRMWNTRKYNGIILSFADIILRFLLCYIHIGKQIYLISNRCTE